MTTHHNDEVHRAYLALLLAVLDGDDQRAHAIINTTTDPAELAHYAAQKMVASIDTEDHPDMRADLLAELEGEGDGG
jgi:hypothetical protein